MVRRVLPGRRARRSDAVGAAAAAASTRTLAVLLQAGATPAGAWRHLAEAGDEHAQRVVERCSRGDAVPAAIAAEGGSWHDVAAAWQVAATVGAPLAAVLRSLADSMLDAAAAADDVRIALAEPAGTARLLLWMPLAGLLLGFALGFDTWGTVTRNPVAAACVAFGALLIAVARRWTAALLRRAEPEQGTPGLHAELVAVALAGGVSTERALRIVADAPAERVDGAARTLEVLQLSRSAGVPAGELLRAAAAQERQAARTAGRLRAARLSSQLLVPLGVCTLPAFLLLGVAPLLFSVLSSVPVPL